MPIYRTMYRNTFYVPISIKNFQENQGNFVVRQVVDIGPKIYQTHIDPEYDLEE